MIGTIISIIVIAGTCYLIGKTNAFDDREVAVSIFVYPLIITAAMFYLIFTIFPDQFKDGRDQKRSFDNNAAAKVVAAS